MLLVEPFLKSKTLLFVVAHAGFVWDKGAAFSAFSAFTVPSLGHRIAVCVAVADMGHVGCVPGM